MTSAAAASVAHSLPDCTTISGFETSQTQASPALLTQNATSSRLPSNAPQQGKQWCLERLPQGGFAPGLEGMRGLAILMTAYSHVAREPYATTDPLGHCGVTIFFVLSGYNIMGSLLRTGVSEEYGLPFSVRASLPSDTDENLASVSQRLVNADPKEGWLQKLPAAHIHRLKRLLPSIVIMVVLINLLNAALGVHAWDVMGRYSLMALTFTTNWRWLWQGENPGPFVNMWSLGPTEQFNVLMSLAGPRLLSMSEVNRRSVLCSVALLSYAVRVYTSAYPDNLLHIHWHYDTFPNLWRFLVGATLRYIPLPRVFLQSHSVYLGIAVVASAPYLMTWPQPDYRAIAAGWRDIVAPMTLWGDVLVAIGACLIIAGCRTTSPSPLHFDWRAPSVLLESAVLRFFGKVSYTFYLYQLPILILFGWERGRMGVVYEVVALGLSIATTFWIEDLIRSRLQDTRPSSRRGSAKTLSRGDVAASTSAKLSGEKDAS